MCNIWGWKFSTSAYRSWSISGTHVMAWLPCCCCVATWLCSHACQTSFLYFFCTLKGNYVWRFHEVHTTIAPCLSTALTICLCVWGQVKFGCFCRDWKSSDWVSTVFIQLYIFALGPNRARAGKKTAICQEQIKVAGGSAQRLVERRPVGDFRHPHRTTSIVCRQHLVEKTFQQSRFLLNRCTPNRFIGTSSHV